MGLTGIAERIHALGGTFDAGPRDGAWVVAAGIPVGGAVPEPLWPESLRPEPPYPAPRRPAVRDG